MTILSSISRHTVHTGRALSLLLGIFLLASPGALALAQQGDRSTTERRLETLKEQIEQDQNRLSETSQAEQATQKKLRNLRREIALREELSATYERRLQQLSAERDSLRASLDALEARIDELREEYEYRATHAYKYGRLHDVGLILAAQSINQMLIRIQYLNRFADQRRDRLSSIQSAANEMAQRRQSLDSTRQRTEQLLAEAGREKANLRRLRSNQQDLVRALQAQGESLREEIEEKRSAAQQLEAQIRRMVAAENERTREDAPTAAEREAYANLSASFEQNRGQLPWPADGVVTEGYGTRTSEYGTQTRHPGVFIATNPQAEVRGVFDGTVSGIDFVPGYGQYLVVRHGDFLSVYSNFSLIYVKEGDAVSAGQVLGRAGTEAEPRGAGLFFAVFDKDTNAATDPTNWLRAR